MGRLCRAMDWSATPLGPIDRWPQGLRTTAGMVVEQGIAMNLCWGPELIQIYNDAYRDIMADKHPDGLGRSVLWSWAEIREEIGPLFERVFQGETVYFEDLLLRIERHGSIVDAYFTFSYSPVRVASGAVGGALINCYETTQQVQARALQAERDRLLEELKVERARLEYVFQRAPSFLALVRGPKHLFELANEAYYQLVGHRELQGRPVREALPEVVGQGFVELLDGVLGTGEPFIGRELPVQLARTRGTLSEERFVDFVYLPYTEPDGTRSGVIAHGYDVTEQVLARREVERLLKESESARAEAEAANQGKSDFLAAMSHELRTPLNAIGGYVELLEMGIHGPVTGPQRASLDRIATNQKHLLTLINDILSYAKLEAGQVEFDLHPLAATGVLASIEPLVAPMAEGKGIAYTVLECDPSIHFEGDGERVRQILLNLVGNAIKFTPAGGWVVLSCTRDADAVHIDVRDSGPGIPPEKQESIFDPFMQVDRRLNHPQEGVGLGLAISRDLARAMGGELSVRSVPGEGSTFTLRLAALAEP
jgi:signal transduction histidine kinase